LIRISDIRILYIREIRSALRERNIVFNTILMPVFLYPMLLWIGYTGITFVFGQTEGFISKVVVNGDVAVSGAFESMLREDDQISLVSAAEPVADVREGDVDLVVTITASPQTLEDNFHVLLTFDQSKDRSVTARTRVEALLDEFRALYMQREAERLGLTMAAYQQFWVETKNMATDQQMGRFILGLLIPMMLVVMVGVGSMYAAIDATAGEREKSTWETIMTAATDRTNIVVAKYLYVASMATIAGLLNFTAMLVSMKSILAPLLGDRIDMMSFSVPWMSLPLIILVTVLLALFIAAGMMILASFARTFKEAQSMISPFYMLIILPVMFLQIPGIEFTLPMALIPVVNVCMVFREAVMGEYQWPQIALTVVVEIGSVGLCLWIAATILRYEDVLTGTFDGNMMKFLKERVLTRRAPTGGSR
jgi:sodium transport system permease protein